MNTKQKCCAELSSKDCEASCFMVGGLHKIQKTLWFCLFLKRVILCYNCKGSGQNVHVKVIEAQKTLEMCMSKHGVHN
jgi:hypothetical protein